MKRLLVNSVGPTRLNIPQQFGPDGQPPSFVKGSAVAYRQYGRLLLLQNLEVCVFTSAGSTGTVKTSVLKQEYEHEQLRDYRL